MMLVSRILEKRDSRRLLDLIHFNSSQKTRQSTRCTQTLLSQVLINVKARTPFKFIEEPPPISLKNILRLRETRWSAMYLKCDN